MVPLVAQTGRNRSAGKREVWGLEVAALLPGPEVRRIAPCGSIEKDACDSCSHCPAHPALFPVASEHTFPWPRALWVWILHSSRRDNPTFQGAGVQLLSLATSR